MGLYLIDWRWCGCQSTGWLGSMLGFPDQSWATVTWSPRLTNKAQRQGIWNLLIGKGEPRLWYMHGVCVEKVVGDNYWGTHQPRFLDGYVQRAGAPLEFTSVLTRKALSWRSLTLGQADLSPINGTQQHTAGSRALSALPTLQVSCSRCKQMWQLNGARKKKNLSILLQCPCSGQPYYNGYSDCWGT